MKIDYSDYICISEKDIICIDSNGIRYANGFIDFSECAQNYYCEHGGSDKCIGERDITKPYEYTFYTAPMTTHVFFHSKSKIGEFFSKKPTWVRFAEFENKIRKYGYSTYDMS